MTTDRNTRPAPHDTASAPARRSPRKEPRKGPHKGHGAGTARRRRRQWVPPQHGAWAMLIVPYLAGLIAVGFQWPHLPLLVAWLAAYPLSYFALLAVKTRRYERFRTQLLVFGAATLAAGGVTVAARPQVLSYAPLFAVVLVVNGVFAARRDDRALVNGLVSVVGAMLILPVVATVAGRPPAEVADALVVSLLYFAGTVFFVKTCIRERDNRALLRASVVFHAAALAVAVWVAPLYAVPFGWYLVRAAALPHRGLSPKHLGMIEIASSALLLAAVAFA